MQQKTYSPKAGDVDRRWFVVDAAGVPLGRLSTRVARVLTGKEKPTYARHLDMGDFVVVVNAEATVLTGRKEQEKIYHRQSGRPGGLKSRTAAQVRANRPERLVELAVKRMLPKGPLGRRQLKKLKVYAGSEHPHAAQNPRPLDLASKSSDPAPEAAGRPLAQARAVPAGETAPTRENEAVNNE